MDDVAPARAAADGVSCGAASLGRDAFVVRVSCPLPRRRVKQRASAGLAGMWKHLRKEPERAGERSKCSPETSASAAAEHALALLLDDAAGLVAAGRGIGGGADAVALVLDGIEARFLGRRAGAAAREAGPQGLQDRDHRGAPLSKA